MPDTTKYAEAFDVVDSNDDGVINADELRRMMQALGDEVSDEQAREMVRKVDADGDGQITLEEFARFMEGG